MGEFPLILFTVLSQMAAGAVITLWLLDLRGNTMEDTTAKFVLKGIIAALAVSLTASTAHLGQPLEAYRAISHPGGSWLSREIILFGAIFPLMLVYHAKWNDIKIRKKLGGLTACVALIAVLTSGMVYVLPARPAWNNLGPVLFFLVTTFILGPLYVAFLSRQKGVSVHQAVYQSAAIALGMGLCTSLLYLSMLLGQADVAALSGRQYLQSPLFWPRVILGWIIPLGLFAYGMAQSQEKWGRFAPVLLCLALVGELLGRGLFYSSVTSVILMNF